MIWPANATCCPSGSLTPPASDQWIAVKARTLDSIPSADHSLEVRFVTTTFFPSYASLSVVGEPSANVMIAIGIEAQALKLCRMTSANSREPAMLAPTLGFIRQDMGLVNHLICTMLLADDNPFCVTYA